MTTKTWGLLIAVFVLWTMLDSLYAAAAPDTSAANDALVSQIVKVQDVNLLLVRIQVPIPGSAFLTGAVNLVTGNFSFFSGPFLLARLFVVLVMYGILTFGLVVTLGPLLISIASVFVRLIRG